MRNGDSGGATPDMFGIRMTRWSGPDGEQLTGEIRWVEGKPSLMVTEGDEALYRRLERMFWEANIDAPTLANAKGKAYRVH